LHSPYIFQTRVSYTDIDQNLCLSMAGAMRLMQEAAIIHSDQSKYSVMNVEQTRLVWMLVQWRVRMTGIAKWGDAVQVVTWPRTMEKVTSDRCFQIEDAAGHVIAIAETTWLLSNIDTGRLIRIPPEVASAYDLLPEGVFKNPAARFPQIIGDETYTCRVLHRDLDTNRHVNNLVYLDYAREALPASALCDRFPEVIVRYHRQLLLGDEVHCYHTETESGHLVQICGDDPRQVHCSVFYQSV